MTSVFVAIARTRAPGRRVDLVDCAGLLSGALSADRGHVAAPPGEADAAHAFRHDGCLDRGGPAAPDPASRRRRRRDPGGRPPLMTPETPMPSDVRRAGRPTLGRRPAPAEDGPVRGRLRGQGPGRRRAARRLRPGQRPAADAAGPVGGRPVSAGRSGGTGSSGSCARHFGRPAPRCPAATTSSSCRWREYTLAEVDRRLRSLVPAAIRRFGEVGRGATAAERPGGP